MFLIKIIKEGHTTKKTEMDVAIGTVEAEGIIMPTPLFNNSYIPWKPVSFINSIIVDIHIGFRAYKIRPPFKRFIVKSGLSGLTG